MRRIEPYFPLSHCVLRVDDRLILSGIIFFAMQTRSDIGTSRLNEFGLLTEDAHAVVLYDLVKKENAREGEMIRLLKVSLIDKRRGLSFISKSREL